MAFRAYSSDLDGWIVAYAWDFGDGQMGSGEMVSHTYFLSGEYTVVLTVTDDRAGIATADMTITVNEVGENPGPDDNDERFINVFGPEQTEDVQIPCTNTIKVTNRMGQELFTRPCVDGNIILNRQGFINTGAAAGIHILVEDGAGPRKVVVIK